MTTDEKRFDHLTRRIIGCAYTVGNKLAFGFLEMCHENAIVHERRKSGLQVTPLVSLQVWYYGIVVGDFVAELVVESKVLVELKAIDLLAAIHSAWCINYLAAKRLPVSLLINFGKRAEIKRFAGPTLSLSFASSSVSIGAPSAANSSDSNL